jgi:hypothetical protein
MTGRAHQHAFPTAMTKQYVSRHIDAISGARLRFSLQIHCLMLPTGDTESSARQMAHFVTPVAFHCFRVCKCSHDKIRCHCSEQAKTMKYRTVLVSNFERIEKRSNFQLPRRKSRSRRSVGCEALMLSA